MKFILSILLSALCLISTGQTIVDTLPQNKKVVLEEFTGIYCGYCPDGHLIANNLKYLYPDDVFIINIHEGGYASPGTSGDPDFRTPFGTTIANNTGLVGYPAGTINRVEFPGLQQGGSGTALSRTDWSDAAQDIMTEISPINVGIEAVYDSITNDINISCEIYATAQQNTFLNYLHIAVIQNNVPGPQAGAAMFNPSQIINGPWSPTYNHGHMLRHLITGQYGEQMIAATPGSFIANSYSWEIPSDINDITVNWWDLDIIAFITDDSGEILTGTEVVVALPSTNVGISEYTVSQSNSYNKIYDILGREWKVKFGNLPKGMYIINNKLIYKI
jgi:thiol-disulfide isomerase/thioredoxin